MQSNEMKCHPTPPPRRRAGRTDDHGNPVSGDDAKNIPQFIGDDSEKRKAEERARRSGRVAVTALAAVLVMCMAVFMVLAIAEASGSREAVRFARELRKIIDEGVHVIMWLIPLVIIVILLVKNIRVVPQTQAYIIERLGKYHSTWEAGLHLKIPFIDRIANKVSLKEQVMDFEPQSVITKDNVTMKIDTVVYLVIFDPRLSTYGVEHVIPAIENLTATTLRNLVGELTLDQTLTSRDSVNSKLKVLLDEATDPWGIKVNRVELKNIMPPRDIQEAMEKQMRAEREKRETILRAEGSKESQILEATGRKEAAILDAEAAKQKAILEAQADREAAITRAEGQAEAIQKVKKAEAEGIRMLKDAGADQAVLHMKGLEALKDMAQGTATTMFIPSDLAGLAGALATLKEAADKKQDK